MTFLGTNLGDVARQATEGDPVIEAENAVESVTAPAIGGTVQLANGPLVEGNLTLTNTATEAEYVLGVDYLEDPEGGFENLAIPPGTALTADYFYHSDAPLSVPGGGSLASTSHAEPVVSGENYDPLILTDEGDIVVAVVRH